MCSRRLGYTGSDLRTDGEGASGTNPGVLVTHVGTLFRSAVGLPGCVQRRLAKTIAPACNTQEMPARSVQPLPWLCPKLGPMETLFGRGHPCTPHANAINTG